MKLPFLHPTSAAVGAIYSMPSDFVSQRFLGSHLGLTWNFAAPVLQLASTWVGEDIPNGLLSMEWAS